MEQVAGRLLVGSLLVLQLEQILEPACGRGGCCVQGRRGLDVFGNERVQLRHGVLWLQSPRVHALVEALQHGVEGQLGLQRLVRALLVHPGLHQIHLGNKVVHGLQHVGAGRCLLVLGQRRELVRPHVLGKRQLHVQQCAVVLLDVGEEHAQLGRGVVAEHKPHHGHHVQGVEGLGQRIQHLGGRVVAGWRHKRSERAAHVMVPRNLLGIDKAQHSQLLGALERHVLLVLLQVGHKVLAVPKPLGQVLLVNLSLVVILLVVGGLPLHQPSLFIRASTAAAAAVAVAWFFVGEVGGDSNSISSSSRLECAGDWHKGESSGTSCSRERSKIHPTTVTSRSPM
eukprot:m.225803 g.225803  ORF g.225803 m.225803 type:complete len:340 (-) comp22354_c2_seq3:1255-2274(-)